jgi:hypothetical protein
MITNQHLLLYRQILFLSLFNNITLYYLCRLYGVEWQNDYGLWKDAVDSGRGLCEVLQYLYEVTEENHK